MDQKNELSMNAFDGKPVKYLFVILSKSREEHLKILSKLAVVLQKEDFRNALEENPTMENLHKFLEDSL